MRWVLEGSILILIRIAQASATKDKGKVQRVQTTMTTSQCVFSTIEQLASSRLILTYSGDLSSRAENSNARVRAVEYVGRALDQRQGRAQRTIACPKLPISLQSQYCLASTHSVWFHTSEHLGHMYTNGLFVQMVMIPDPGSLPVSL